MDGPLPVRSFGTDRGLRHAGRGDAMALRGKPRVLIRCFRIAPGSDTNHTCGVLGQCCSSEFSFLSWPRPVLSPLRTVPSRPPIHSARTPRHNGYGTPVDEGTSETRRVRGRFEPTTYSWPSSRLLRPISSLAKNFRPLRGARLSGGQRRAAVPHGPARRTRFVSRTRSVR